MLKHGGGEVEQKLEVNVQYGRCYISLHRSGNYAFIIMFRRKYLSYASTRSLYRLIGVSKLMDGNFGGLWQHGGVEHKVSGIGEEAAGSRTLHASQVGWC